MKCQSCHSVVLKRKECLICKQKICDVCRLDKEKICKRCSQISLAYYKRRSKTQINGQNYRCKNCNSLTWVLDTEEICKICHAYIGKAI